MSVAVLGSINVDIAAYAERLPRPGETLHGTSYAVTLGGKGANQAVAAARLGSEVKLIGRIGCDRFGETAAAELADAGIDTALVLRDPEASTGIAIIGIDARGENAITVIAGANLALDGSDVERGRAGLASARVVMLQLETPPSVSYIGADIARAGGARVIFDPAPAPYEGLSPDLYRRVDILTPNEIEAEALVGFRPSNREEGARACRLLRERGIGTAIVKLGERGVCFLGPEGEGFVPPYKVASIDSVAAGDCFNGGLAFALDRGRPMAEAVRFAAACGALATTRRGAAASAPALPEVEELVARGLDFR
ncbi:MAG: ribokinase [Parvibaculaceae bacterium]